VRVTILGSGSRGNSLVVDLGGRRIAIDAGFGPRPLARRLQEAGIAPESIDACALTHEHQDHAQGALHARLKWRWTLVATPPTLAALPTGSATSRLVPLEHETSHEIGPVRITLFAIGHDAANPSAVVLEDTESGARVGVAHDLGVTSDHLARSFERLDMLVLEANHDMAMLRAGRYPRFLQERIAGPRGHLSNEQAADFAARISHRGLKNVMLAHLSANNNTPQLAHSAVSARLRGTPFGGKVVVAGQDSITCAGSMPAAQLQLL